MAAQERERLENTINQICKIIPLWAALEQTAEEADELGQACLKMCRALGNGNPTPRSPDEVREMIVEEYTDVRLCIEVLKRIMPLNTDAPHLMQEKATRWLARLRGDTPDALEEQAGNSLASEDTEIPQQNRWIKTI